MVRGDERVEEIVNLSSIYMITLTFKKIYRTLFMFFIHY